MKHVLRTVENKNVIESIQTFLQQLLESKCVDALLVPRVLPGKDGFVQVLIKDPEVVKETNPLAPTMAVQSATIIKQLSMADEDTRIGVVLKPCELRAGIELVKFLQANFENLVIIGVDCPGTVEVRDYAAMEENDRAVTEKALIDWSSDAPADIKIRDACRICEFPAPVQADITIGIIGCDISREIACIINERFEEKYKESLQLDLKDGMPDGREEAVKAIVAKRRETRGKILGEMRGQIDSIDKFLKTFSTCIRCYNCMHACPICYCKECVFESPVFEHSADQLLKLVDRKNAVRMPADTLMFHLTRLTHMATSCVGCGMCDSACPNNLPVSRLFNLIGKELQDMFEYVPGRNVEEEAPVKEFKEQEFLAEGGAE